MAKKNRPKKINLEDLGGFVFSTNPEFEPPAFEESGEESLKPGEQLLELYFEKKGRGGKQVVIIRGFQGNEKELKDLGKVLKQHCGVGGSSRTAKSSYKVMFAIKRPIILKKKGTKQSESVGNAFNKPMN